MKNKIYILLIILVTFAAACKTTKNTTVDAVKFANPDEEAKAYLSEALRLMLYDNYDEAIKNVNQCIKRQPENAAYYYLLSQIYTAKEEPELAMDYMMKAVELDDDNYFYKYYLAKLHIKKYDIESATALLEEVILVSKSYRPFYELGYYYYYDKDYKNSIFTYERLQEKEGVTSYNSDLKLRAYERLDHDEKYRDELIFLCDFFPFKQEYKEKLIDYYLDLNEIDEANKILLQSMATELPIYSFYLQFAKHFKEKNNFDSTFIYTKLAFEQDDGWNDKVYFLEDNDFFSIKNYPKGEVDTLFSILYRNEDKKDKWFDTKYAKYLTNAKRLHKAINVLNKDTVSDYYNYETNKMLVELYFQTANFPKLDSISSSMTDFYPNLPDFFLYSAIAKTATQDYSSAEIFFKAGKDLIYSDLYMATTFNFFMSYYYSLQNDTENFKTFYNDAIVSSETYPDIKLNFSKFLLSQNVMIDSVSVLLDACNKQVSDISDENELIYANSFLTYRQANFDKAEELILPLIDNSDFIVPKYYELYGDIQKSKNNEEQAIRYWQIAYKQDTFNIKLKQKIGNR